MSLFDITAEQPNEGAIIDSPATVTTITLQSVDGDIAFYDSADGTDITPETAPVLVISRWCLPVSEGGAPITLETELLSGLYYVRSESTTTCQLELQVPDDGGTGGVHG